MDEDAASEHNIERLAERARVRPALEAGPSAAAAPGAERHGLPPRELEILPLVAAGRTDRQIAAELLISEKTSSVYVSNILGELGASSRTEAAAIAHRLGLLELRAAEGYRALALAILTWAATSRLGRRLRLRHGRH